MTMSLQRCIRLLLIVIALMPSFLANSVFAFESFKGNANVSPTGAALYNIPLPPLPGVAGFAPQLSLNYNSQAGNGVLGVGWNLVGLSAISRCPQTRAQDGDGAIGGLSYSSSDRLCLDGERLLPASPSTPYWENSAYRQELENFKKITKVTSSVCNSAYEVRDKSGVIYEYGTTADSCVGGAYSQVGFWLLSRVSVAGKSYQFSYLKEGGGITFRVWTMEESMAPPRFTSVLYILVLALMKLRGIDTASKCKQVEG